MSQNLPLNNFEWIKETCQLNEDFIKNCNEQSEIFAWSECSIPRKITRTPYCLTIFTWKKEILKSRKACYQFTWSNEYVIDIRNL